MTEQERLEAWYMRQVERVAEGLRRLADEVERTGRINKRGMFKTAGYSAAQVVHSVQWGFANLPLEALLSAAHEYDAVAEDDAGGVAPQGLQEVENALRERETK